jgi:hypothetical protein
MEICQRQEDAGSSIIPHLSLVKLSGKSNFNFGSENSFKKSENIKK